MEIPNNYDFCGWASKNDLKCSDGRVIRKNAFAADDGKTVPLVWNHQHDSPFNILGHALLINKPGGMYTYGYFNDTKSGINAKNLVESGDVDALSICANKLKQKDGNVFHGAIREVSLVLAGANPGAFIEATIKHGEESEDESVIYTGEEISISHSAIGIEDEEEDAISHSEPGMEIKEDKKVMTEPENKTKEVEMEEDQETIKDVFDTLTDKQKNVVYPIIGQALEDQKENTDDDVEGGNDTMKHHNIFDNEDMKNDVLSHGEMMEIFSDVKRYGSLKDTVLAHGIENVDYLFPEAQSVDTTPQFIKRNDDWVQKVMSDVHHTPFSRIKSTFADITAEDARAKGYVKGNLKTEEVFSLLKRTTTPTTVYKKQKMDRDDVVDITDFDVVAWLKSEMRGMLDEELARAFLVGDGRLSSSDDKINEQNIRPIWTDADLFTIKKTFSVASGATDDVKAKAFIRAAIKSRKDYKGSGNPSLYTTEDILTDCLLLEDTTGRVIYDSIEKLRIALRVKEIITTPVMEDLSRTNNSTTYNLMGIIVNLNDYYVGADKGGAVNMFDDFDIDFNQQKYLIETRCSGALTKPYSAISLEMYTA